MQFCGGSWAELSAGRLAANAKAVAAAVAPAGVIAVVKADAYGHGLSECAKILRGAGVKRFAVAYVAEGVAVRKAVPDAELVFLLGRAGAGDVGSLRAWGVTPGVVSTEHAAELDAAARADGGGPLGVHLKLDTGMGRLGFPVPAALDDAKSVLGLEGLRVEGLCMHFAKVDPVGDPGWAEGQRERFAAAGAVLEAAAGRRLFRHASATAAALQLPAADGDSVRVGISLYGYGTEAEGGRFRTAPILQWKTKVVQVKRVPKGFYAGYDGTWRAERETILATLSVGYADGYRRSFGNRAEVLIGGRRCKVAGRVSMNWLIVDAGPAGGPGESIRPGDEAVLLGESGGEHVWADELAKLDGTISYEILTGISRQLERRVVG